LPTPPEPTAQAAELARVLEENDGSIEKTWRALGLTSRYALMRLLRKHNVTVLRRAMRR
jgi:ActR/RegA family two-component response regulator